MISRERLQHFRRKVHWYQRFFRWYASPDEPETWICRNDLGPRACSCWRCRIGGYERRAMKRREERIWKSDIERCWEDIASV
jgi:hypothetical protein